MKKIYILLMFLPLFLDAQYVTQTGGSNLPPSNNAFFGCAGGSITLGAFYNPSTSASVSWERMYPNPASLGSGATKNISVNSGTVSYRAIGGGFGGGVVYFTIIGQTAPQAFTLPPSGPTQVCAGQTLTYTQLENVNLLNYIWTYPTGWTGPTSTIFQSVNVVCATNVVSGNITVARQNACGTGPASSIFVNVNNAIITTTAQAIRCGTGPLTLGATASSGTINWYSAATGGAALGSGTSFITPSINTTTTYYVDVTDNGCTSATRTAVTATVNPLPTNIFAQDTIAACGSSYSLSAGAGFNSYNWSTGDTTQNLTVNNSGWYQCTVSNGAGCTATDSVFVSLVNANILQNDTTICAGNTVQLAVSTTSTSSLSSCVLPTNLQQGLVGYWPFCGNANDESGNGNNGTVNGATLTSDRFGTLNSSYDFDGVNNEISVNGSNSITYTNGLTISCWFKATTAGSSSAEFLVAKGNDNSQGHFHLAYHSNVGKFQGDINEIGNDLYTLGMYPIPFSGWKHVLFIYNNNNLLIYINNVLAGTYAHTIPIGILNNTIYFGSSGMGGQFSYFTKGQLDDIGIWNRALTQQEASQLYTSSTQTYLWSTGDTTSTINVTPPQTTTYYCTVNNGITSCTDSVTITVNPLPTNIFAQDTIAACGSSYALSAGAGYSNYNWSTGDTTSSITVNNSGWYQCTVTNSAGCIASDTIYIAINALPTITATSSATTVCAGTSVTLTGGGATTYTWTGGVANGVSFVPTATTTYTVTGTNAAGCTNSATTTITVNALPTVTATSSAVTVCAGTSVTLNGGGATTYTWTGGVTNGVSFVPTATTTYTVTGTDVNGCTNAATTTITENTLPTVTATSSAVTVCAGTSVTLNGGGATTYTWSGGVVNGVSFVPTTTTTYTVTGTDVNGCTNTAITTITVNALPTVTANASATTVCAGTSVTLNGVGATTYTWSGGVVNGVSFVPTATTTYTVTGTDVNGCTNAATTTISVNTLPTVTANSTATTVCAGTSVTLTGGGATTYTWTGGVANGVSFVPTATTTYTVTGTNAAGCTNSATTTITVNALPTVTATSSATTVCAGTSVTVTGGGASTYTWTGGVTNGVSFIPTATTTYTVTGTNAAGCSKTATKTITVNALPTVTSNLSAVTVCTGTSVTLNGGGATTYTWTGGVVNGVSFVPTATTTYTVTGTNAAGCTNSATTTITVNALPTVTANASATTICAGTSVTLTGGGVSTYTWSGGVTNGASFIPTATTTYTVTGTNAAGCSNTATKTITVNALPTVTANASATSVCAGTSVTLTGGGATTYTWSGGVTNGASFIPTATTTYTVTTSNATGCTNTATQLITVNALPTVTANATATNLCTGSSVTLTGGGASTYTWTGGVTNGVSFIPTVTTTYTVTGTDVNGCKNTASKTISMNILPTLVISASKKLYCQKDASGILTGNPVGGVWSGIGVSGNTFNPTVAGLGSFYAVYSFTATNGCTNKDSLLMTVSTCLDIAETTTANLFSVYPNPTTSEINVKTDAQLMGSEYIVYDNSGKIILKGKIKSANTLIKLSDFSAGVYYFTVVNKLYGKQTIKVIKE